MRGKPVFAFSTKNGSGLIPAHAGKTLTASKNQGDNTAHPRACGENLPAPHPASDAAGSSPRMRGKPPVTLFRPPVTRLIPAHAGKTISLDFLRKNSGAHPRACGENQRTKSVAASVTGSSPRMRGKRVKSCSVIMRVRLIPAHAGKTDGARWIHHRPWAHPRACGENGALPATGMSVEGSSPRMRGKRIFALWIENPAGLIPAHAGKTAYSQALDHTHTAHPRACGENTMLTVSV